MVPAYIINEQRREEQREVRPQLPAPPPPESRPEHESEKPQRGVVIVHILDQE